MKDMITPNRNGCSATLVLSKFHSGIFKIVGASGVFLGSQHISRGYAKKFFSSRRTRSIRTNEPAMPSVSFENNASLPGLIEAQRPIIFFDWDDTLLCSSHLAQHGHTLRSNNETMDSNLRAQLQDLAVCITKAIIAAKELGEVCIVTNAEAGWVEMSAKKFMPELQPLLTTVAVISARHHFEHLSPSSPVSWKLHAFRWLLNSMENSPRNVLCFGDSHVEREAIRTATRDFGPHIRTKTIKFADKPSPEQLRRQLELVTACLPDVSRHAGELDLALTINMNMPAPQLPVSPSAGCDEMLPDMIPLSLF